MIFLQGIVDAIALGSLYAIFALGIALIYGVLKMINFAHSELVTIGAYVLILMSTAPLALRILVLVVTVVAVAVLMERVAFRPVRGSGPVTMLITSFAVSYLLQNLAILVFGPDLRSGVVWSWLNVSFPVGPVRVLTLDVVTVSLTIVLLVGLALFLRFAPLGIQMRAAAEDFTTARLVGVRANVVIAAAFAISGLLAAVAAFLLTAQTGVVTNTIGVQVVLMAFVATILGGMGSLTGAVAGAYALGAVSVALQLLLPLEMRPFRDAFLFGAVFVVLVFRPNGLITVRSAQGRV
ncbi:branched-chain amino acid transport system permease protein [Microbacteriaceae bacterium SG_E_30_P1]|uniref:Branched-chain amino acid transport system permease protein n=1 Tax=Antiquaquibacter oligotrophicus TaxID=2880260 RepID=A0ABT6KTP6_9MICO|nr:branched-chain amino acid ABC transporter permease [Antiquaquibacter oligotrophicus]MDH6182457.1 branched-chain amino acid transport system permease protein [Antiquaquibacter oligotrophicus]UDF14572.1 branched-chain amino acid ABC transporter permease [Antiquaquibacter oligotrophicus]